MTFPRYSRPCMLVRALTVPFQAAPGNRFAEVQAPWRWQVFVDDDNMKAQIIAAEDTIQAKEVPPNAVFAVPNWTTMDVDLSKYSGRTVS